MSTFRISVTLVLVILVSSPICFISCGSDDNPCNPSEIDLVMGMAFYDNNGQAIGQWNKPNDHSQVDSESAFAAYPNPAVDVLAIIDENGIEDFWIVPASCQAICKDLDVVPELISNANISSSDLDESQIRKSTTSIGGTSQIQIDVSELETGLYKLFIRRTDNTIVWQNLMLNENPLIIDDALNWLSNECQ